MKLYCARHGHAEQSPDQYGERPLSLEGIKEISKVAAYLKHQLINITHVKYSGKLRTQQSAVILADAVANEQALEASELLGIDYPTIPLIESIQQWHDDTMLVGHMPFMSQLVSALILGNDSYDIVRFYPGTIVCLEQLEGRWILNWMLHPSLVPD